MDKTKLANEIYNKAILQSSCDIWLYEDCEDQKDCWCGLIRTKSKFVIEKGEPKEHFYIVRSGSVDKEFCKQIVSAHNGQIENHDEALKFFNK